jgi:hypothetical protein
MIVVVIGTAGAVLAMTTPNVWLVSPYAVLALTIAPDVDKETPFIFHVMPGGSAVSTYAYRV